MATKTPSKKVTTKKVNAPAKPTISIQAGTEKTMVGTWHWTRSDTKEYIVRWEYNVKSKDGWYFGVQDQTITIPSGSATRHVWSGVPDNALYVRFRVKPISKTTTVSKKEINIWKSGWSPCSTSFKVPKKVEEPETKPANMSAPEVTIDNFKLTATISSSDPNTNAAWFYVVANEKTFVTSGMAVKTLANSMTFSCTVKQGNTYKVRVRGVRFAKKGEAKIKNTAFGNYAVAELGDYSDYTTPGVGTKPAETNSKITCKFLTTTTADLTWTKYAGATSYEIEYTTNKDYFDVYPSGVSTSTATTNHAIVDLNNNDGGTGVTWYFRLRAVNDQGHSKWTAIASLLVGEKPGVPTTWSSTGTVIVGEELWLYWQHNTIDGSKQTRATIEITGGGQHSLVDVAGEHQYYKLDISDLTEGAELTWRVQTKGIFNEFSDWSIERQINVYARPVISLTFSDEEDGDLIETVEHFPVYLKAEVGPATQTAMSYNVSVISNEQYEIIDAFDNVTTVVSGEEIYSKYFDVGENILETILSASDLTLNQGTEYTLHCVAAMDSGLIAETDYVFTVDFDESVGFIPEVEMGIDFKNLVAYINPYCVDDDGELIPDVELSVYRMELNGEFTKIGETVNNEDEIYITDPHPQLDYTRYRVVGRSTVTGDVYYNDIDPEIIGETAVVIQWNESYDILPNVDSGEDELVTESWSGNMLKLYYNIDISSNFGQEVSLVKYIGRKRPVSYYGTQLDETASWSVEVPKDDEDTMSLLRKLSVWTDDVYIRQPDGVGYWANVSVSFNKNHNELTIPVSIDITRVEGGE